MEVAITQTLKQPSPRLQGRVLSVKAQPNNAECPGKGELIDFRPETADYQGELMRRKWPKPGQTVRMRYLYLDGECKFDGHSGPCRIRHYPLD